MADTTVNAAVQTSSDPRQSPWGPYWSDISKGVIVFTNSFTQPLVHVMRTTDKGANWTDITLGGGNVSQMAAWFDKETPGDSGTLVHIIWFNNNNNSIEYCTIDVADATVGTVRTIESGLANSGFAGTRVAITKLENGRIIVAYNTASEFETKKSAETSAPYFAAAVTDIADVLESASANDHLLLYPANVDAGDAAAIFWDRSTNQLSVKMYDDSDGVGGSWTEKTFGGTMVDDNFWPQMDGAIRHSDKKLLFAAHSDADDGGDNLLTWEIAFDSIASPTITVKANVFTGQGESAQVAILINQQNNDVYLAYLKGGTWTATVDVVYHLSDDDLATWETESAYSEAAADDNRRVMGGRTVGDAGGRWQPVWFNDDLNDLFVNLVNDVEIIADISVEGDIVSTLNTRTALWGPYWSDESTAVIVLLDAGNDISFSRTTDKGATWSKTQIQPGSTTQVAAWYDQETPGDTGTLVNIAWLDSNSGAGASDIKYVTVDVSDGTQGTTRTIVGDLTVSNVAGETRCAVTKAVNGNIIVAFSTQSEIGCHNSTDKFASNNDSIADIYETTTEEDWVLLFPANVDDGDICALIWDRSADDLFLEMYDNSLNTWSRLSTALNADMVDDALHLQMDGAIRHSDKHLLVVAHDQFNDANDDLKTWDITVDSIASPTVNAKTNVYTGQDESAHVSMMINQQNNDVYVAYSVGAPFHQATANTVTDLSTDNLGSWAGQTTYSEDPSDDIRLTHCGRTVGDSGGRFQPSWYNDDSTEVFINDNNDVEIAAVAAGSKIKTVSTIAIASVKTISGIAIASVKTRDTISNV